MYSSRYNQFTSGSPLYLPQPGTGAHPRLFLRKLRAQLHSKPNRIRMCRERGERLESARETDQQHVVGERSVAMPVLADIRHTSGSVAQKRHGH